MREDFGTSLPYRLSEREMHDLLRGHFSVGSHIEPMPSEDKTVQSRLTRELRRKEKQTP